MKMTSFSSAQQGVVLIEAMVAILLFSIGVLAIAGLQASMVQNASSSKFRSEAAYIAQRTIGEMWADPLGTSTSARNIDPESPASDIGQLLPEGKMTVILQPGAGTQFLVTVGWTAPGEEPATDWVSPPCRMPVAHCFTTFATITP